jgi:CheY-specific phosphatase CheX
MATLSSLQSRIDQIDGFLVESVKDVCSTMLSWTATEAPGGLTDPAAFQLGAVSGCIGFAGGMTGSIFLSCSDALAEAMARTILGGGGVPHPQDVSDVVAELTNMLAGGCKSRLCDQECPVVMSIPNIIRGQAIRAFSRDITFMLKREFSLSISGGEKLQVIILGKFD